MAFFYEAEHSKWTYKERFNNWADFDLKTCRALERLWQKFHGGDKTEKEAKWKKDNQDWLVDVESLSARPDGNRYFRSGIDVSRVGYPYPKKSGDKKKLKKMFLKFRDDDEPEYMDELKLREFYKKVDVDPTGIGCLILQAMCGAEFLNTIKQDDFVDTLSKCGCSSFAEIKQRIHEMQSKILSSDGKKHLKSFAKRVFRMCCEDDRQKSLPLFADEENEGVVFALIVFSMLYCKDNRTFVYGESFLEFLKLGPVVSDEEVKSITQDDWIMIAEFLLTTKDDSKFGDEYSDWPLIIESYMEFNTKKSAKPQTT